jgi:hypothetical protein
MKKCDYGKFLIVLFICFGLILGCTKASEDGDDSDAVSTPTGLTAVTKNGAVYLSWNKNSESDILGYGVCKAVSPDYGYDLATNNVITTINYTDSSVVANKTYKYKVFASDTNSNVSEYSSEVTIALNGDITPPNTPSGLTYKSVSVNANPKYVELEWTKNNESDLKGYNIYESIDGGSYSKINSSSLIPTTSSTYKVENPSSQKTYQLKISAVDKTGNESALSSATTGLYYYYSASDLTIPSSPNMLVNIYELYINDVQQSDATIKFTKIADSQSVTLDETESTYTAYKVVQYMTTSEGTSTENYYLSTDATLDDYAGEFSQNSLYKGLYAIKNNGSKELRIMLPISPADLKTVTAGTYFCEKRPGNGINDIFYLHPKSIYIYVDMTEDTRKIYKLKSSTTE